MSRIVFHPTRTNVAHREIKFEVDEVSVLDRDENELMLTIAFRYDWAEHELYNIIATDADGYKIDITDRNRFYPRTIDDIYHELHEHVANRTEEPNF